jgi:hypothetical protein
LEQSNQARLTAVVRRGKMNPEKKDDAIIDVSNSFSWIGDEGIEDMNTDDLLVELWALHSLFEVDSLKKIEATFGVDKEGKVGIQLKIPFISGEGGKSKGTESGLKFTLERPKK